MILGLKSVSLGEIQLPPSRPSWCILRHLALSSDVFFPPVRDSLSLQMVAHRWANILMTPAYAVATGCCRTGGTSLCGSTENVNLSSLLEIWASRTASLPSSSSSLVNLMAECTTLMWAVKSSRSASINMTMVSSTYWERNLIGEGLQGSLLEPLHKYICNYGAHWRPHCCSLHLWVNLAIEREVGRPQTELE